ncbi:MAG: hypothetical protein AAFX06_29110 [Planctomycetota bacterium]
MNGFELVLLHAAVIALVLGFSILAGMLSDRLQRLTWRETNLWQPFPLSESVLVPVQTHRAAGEVPERLLMPGRTRRAARLHPLVTSNSKTDRPL